MWQIKTWSHLHHHLHQNSGFQQLVQNCIRYVYIHTPSQILHASEGCGVVAHSTFNLSQSVAEQVMEQCCSSSTPCLRWWQKSSNHFLRNFEIISKTLICAFNRNFLSHNLSRSEQKARENHSKVIFAGTTLSSGSVKPV